MHMSLLYRQGMTTTTVKNRELLIFFDENMEQGIWQKKEEGVKALHLHATVIIR